MGAKYEIIGAEHFIATEDVKCTTKLTVESAKFTGSTGTLEITTHTEPKFPEKYTPVIVRDSDDESWVPELFLQKDEKHPELWFDCLNCPYKQMAPLMGNEKLVETNKKPPFYWKVYGETARLIKP